MPSPSVQELLAEALAAFSFLGVPIDSRVVVPEDFRGGFVVAYPGDVRVQYLDCEITISKNERELFGVANHGSFAGNMFSREHLPSSLKRIAEYVRAQVAVV